MGTEIACLSLQETGVVLAGVVDDEKRRSDFFRHKVVDFDEISAIDAPGCTVPGTGDNPGT